MKKLQLAGCIIKDDQGRLLLLHRNTPKRTQWEIPGGKVEEDESPEQAAIREAKEELGIDIRIKGLVGAKSFTEDDFEMDYFWFESEIKKGKPKVKEPKTFDDLAYFDQGDFNREGKHLSPNLRNYLDAMKITVTFQNASGVIVRDRKVLMVRAKGKDFFLSPGGGMEKGETALKTVKRELLEECSIVVKDENLDLFGTYDADAKGYPGYKVRMHAFLVKDFSGELKPSDNIEEHAWINTKNQHQYETGSVFKKHVIPKLHKLGIID